MAKKKAAASKSGGPIDMKTGMPKISPSPYKKGKK